MLKKHKEVAVLQDHHRCTVVILSILALALLPLVDLFAAEYQYRATDRPAPLKGLIDYRSTNSSMEWHTFALRSVVKGPNEYDWTFIESSLNKNAAKGKTTILRPVMDFVSSWPSVPAYLTNIAGATFTYPSNSLSYNTLGYRFDGMVVPVYTNEVTQHCIHSFIKEFGHKYDGDPRVAFIETGLLGAWGEMWEIKNSKYPIADVPDKLIDAVFLAYSENFKQTKILTRWPKSGDSLYSFGYHDDWFGFWNTPNLYPKYLAKAGPDASIRWKKSPIGGRLHPEYTKHPGYNQAEPYLDQSKIWELIKRDHISWIRYPTNAKELNPTLTNSFQNMASKMGYELYITKANWALEADKDLLNLSITVTNTGVAPFYYPWKVELGIWQDGKLVKTRETDWDITIVIPDEPATTFEASARQIPLKFKDASLLLRVVNPLTNGIPFRFANTEQDTTLDGWLTLGKIQ